MIMKNSHLTIVKRTFRWLGSIWYIPFFKESLFILFILQLITLGSVIKLGHELHCSITLIMNGLSGESQSEFSSSMSFLNSSSFSKRFDTSKRVSIVKEKHHISEASSVATSTCPSEVDVDCKYSEQSPRESDNNYVAEDNQQEDNRRMRNELECESYKSGEDFQSQSPRYEDEDCYGQTSNSQRGPQTMSVGFDVVFYIRILISIPKLLLKYDLAFCDVRMM